MLGMSVPDAIAFGTLVLGLVAMWRGSQRGAEAAKALPPPNPTTTLIGGAIVDSNTLQDLTDAVEKLTEAIIHGIQDSRERTVRTEQEKMNELLRSIADKLEHPRARTRPRDQGDRG